MLTVKIIWLVLMIVCGIVLGYSITGIIKTKKLMNRNYEVYDFRMYLLELASMYNARRIKDTKLDVIHNACMWFVEKYTYEEMLYSDKPLTLEAWYTEKEINEIKR